MTAQPDFPIYRALKDINYDLPYGIVDNGVIKQVTAVELLGHVGANSHFGRPGEIDEVIQKIFAEQRLILAYTSGGSLQGENLGAKMESFLAGLKPKETETPADQVPSDTSTDEVSNEDVDQTEYLDNSDRLLYQVIQILNANK